MSNSMKPPAARRTQVSEQPRRFSFTWVIGNVVLIAMFGFFVYDHNYVRAGEFIVLPILHWLFGRVKPTYEIEDSGICYTNGYRRVHLPWREIDYYFVLPDKGAPGLEQLVFMPKKMIVRNIVPPFTFDPQQIDRVALLYVPQENLPGQDKSRPAKLAQGLNGTLTGIQESILHR